MLEYVKDISDVIISLYHEFGIMGIIGFVICLLIWKYWKQIFRWIILKVNKIAEEIHNEKMLLRDQLMDELNPILIDYRSDVRADRVLYFEYHNSKENLVGIPFKYIELMMQNARYEVGPLPELYFKDISTGTLTNLYDKVRKGEIVYCDGANDQEFHQTYPGIYMNAIGDKKLAFISIPGICLPVGMILLEWNFDEEVDKELVHNISLHNYIPRINALILSKTK